MFRFVCLHQHLMRSHSRFHFLLYLSYPFPFLWLFFFPWKKFPDIPFSNPTCFHIWLFDSSVLHMWFLCLFMLVFPSLFVIIVGFCLVCSSLMFPLYFNFWCFLLCFSFRLLFVRFLLRLLFWFRLYDIGKRCFPCSSGVFVGLVENQFGSGCSAGLSWSCGVRKNKELNNGMCFSIEDQMRLPFANGTRVCAKFAHFVATDKLRKGRRVGKKHHTNSGFGEMRVVVNLRVWDAKAQVK